jgi:hypothetical protein
MNSFGLNWYAAPAILAVFACAIILYLTRGPRERTYPVRLYRMFLVGMLLHNGCEVALFVFANNELPGTLTVGLIYYTLSLFVIMSLAALSLGLAMDFRETARYQLYIGLLSIPMLLMVYPLWFTSWMITGYRLDDGVMPGVAWNSVHGPGYVVLIGTMFFYMLVSAAGLLGGIRQKNRQRRIQCYVVLFSSTPLFVLSTIVLLQLLRAVPLNPYINVTFATPLIIILFLVGTGYAIYRHRLLDIEFYIPWSQERRKKTVFYRQIQTVSERLPSFYDLQEAITQISTALNCPVVVRSKDQTIATPSDDSGLMAKFPLEALADVDRLMTVDDVRDTNPELAKLLRQHKVFAAVPVPQGLGADAVVTWVLLGEALSESVYSSRDFAMVGILFQRMETVLINQLGSLRRELSDVRQMVTTLGNQVSMLLTQQRTPPSIDVARKALFLAEQEESEVIESFGRMARGTLYVGRDRNLFAALRVVFPNMRRLSSPASASLEKYQQQKRVPAVIIYDRSRVLVNEEERLVNLLKAAVHPVAVYVLEAESGFTVAADKAVTKTNSKFVDLYKDVPRDVQIIVVPPGYTSEDLVREVRKDSTSEGRQIAPGIKLDELVASFEKRIIELALAYASGNQAMAARMLDLTPVALHRRIARHGIVVPNELRLLESAGSAH